MDRQAIVGQALDLLNAEGLDGLTVRRLAARLQVKSPALYWHFPSKRELLEEMAQALQAREDFGPPRRDESWQQWLTRRARERRQILLSHRDGARLVAGTRPGPYLLARFEAELAALVECGFTPVGALRVIGTINRFIVGFVLEEQATQQQATNGQGPDEEAAQAQRSELFRQMLQTTPTLAAAMAGGGDSDAAFEDGLRMLIDGIAVGLNADA